MNVQTGSIEITGVSLDALNSIEQRAKAVGSTAEAYLRTLIEQECASLNFTPEELDEYRQAALRSQEQIAQGHYRVYANGDELMDDIEAEVKKRRSQRNQKTQE